MCSSDLSPSHPDFLKALALTAAWGNRVGGIETMKDYLAGSVVPINGKDMRLTQPPTLADVIFYLQGQKQFKTEDIEEWGEGVPDGAYKTRAKLAQHGISPESIGSDKPSEGRLQLGPEGPVYVPHGQSSGDVANL